MLTALLQLGDSALAAALRQSDIAYPLISSVHILGLGLLAGSIVTLDLRMLNIIKRGSTLWLAIITAGRWVAFV
jgi:hypothetical protein